MHFSRMHTVCCSGRRSCHTCPLPAMNAPWRAHSPGMHIPLCPAHPPTCMPSYHAHPSHQACHIITHAPLTTHAPLHHTRTTTVPDGKFRHYSWYLISALCLVRYSCTESACKHKSVGKTVTLTVNTSHLAPYLCNEYFLLK